MLPRVNAYSSVYYNYESDSYINSKEVIWNNKLKDSKKFIVLFIYGEKNEKVNFQNQRE